MTRNRDLGDVAPFVDGVSSNIQTQINAKAPTASPTFTGGVSVTGEARAVQNTTSANLFVAEADMGTHNNRTLVLRSPDTDSASEPFVFNTGNTLSFETDGTERLLIDNDGISVKGGNLNVTAQGSVRMEDAAGGEYAAFQAPTTLTASYIMTMPPNTGSAGQFLQTNGSGVLSFSGVGSSTNVITSNTTATKDNHYYVNGSAITLTLPASPSVGDEVRFSEIAGNTNNVIARNSSNIMSSATDLTVDTAFAVLYLRYVDATIGWALS